MKKSVSIRSPLGPAAFGAEPGLAPKKLRMSPVFLLCGEERGGGIRSLVPVPRQC